MTKILVNGRIRSIELTVDKLLKHPISIKHWVDGGSIEELYGPDWVNYLATPTFDINTAYRPAKHY